MLAQDFDADDNQDNTADLFCRQLNQSTHAHANEFARQRQQPTCEADDEARHQGLAEREYVQTGAEREPLTLSLAQPCVAINERYGLPLERAMLSGCPPYVDPFDRACHGIERPP